MNPDVNVFKRKKLFGAVLFCLLAAVIALTMVTFSSCAHPSDPSGSGFSGSSGSFSDNASDGATPSEDGTGEDEGPRVPIGGNAEVGDY